MNKTKSVFPLILSLLFCFTACDEVKEVGEYDNWKERNLAFTDSIKLVAGSNIVTTGEAADAMVIGEIYGIQTAATTSEGLQYVYCKKLASNPLGERPMYVGWHSKVNAFYYGTLINKVRFDGNFIGYAATDRHIPNPPANAPTEFDQTASFSISAVIPGWTAALQYMRMGERWMLYIPYQSAYGEDGTNSIPGYSALTFDVVLDSFVE